MTDTVRLTPDWAPRTALLTFDLRGYMNNPPLMLSSAPVM